ncbi:MAG TPA: Re/Si-specific NAD(P)(+) transhydrogenase subunit alpha [Candidatus Acidoferrales bacterium]|nr:Re/Si-specific NAD(P)(+) transhydrogenase subunit alpha [Candidatus Acidoferrales bacterium]
MIVGVATETVPGERRVALVPELLSKLTAAGLEIHIQFGAGVEAGFENKDYEEKGAGLASDVLPTADILLKVRPPAASEIIQLREGSVLIGLLEPYTSEAQIKLLSARKVTSFAMDLMPRIARAQSMDALSAMATVAGYKAVLLAANRLSKFFPLLMTAAGTITPARVFVVGAGVAGLEAIGTAKRLGAVVEAYDTRPAVKEEVQSVGAKFVEMGLETKDAEEKGGYARAESPEFYKKQREMMFEHVAAADVVITAALVRGRHAPVLITEEMVRGMRPGSVIVDLASPQGGNCALTEADHEVVRHGVVILGPTNLPSTMPFHASQLYARTVVNFLMHILHDGKVRLDRNDELIRATLVTDQGEMVNESLKAAFAVDTRAS